MRHIVLTMPVLSRGFAMRSLRISLPLSGTCCGTVCACAMRRSVS